MKTRTKKTSTKTGDKEAAEIKPTIQKLEPSVANPPQLFILPKDISASARILTLPNRAPSRPNRYLLCPDKGLYEFTRIAAPKNACRSWLLAQEQDVSLATGTHVPNGDGRDGYILQSPDMMVATSIDPLFILLPAFTGDTSAEATNERREQQYLSPSDYLERLGDSSEHFRQILQTDARSRLEAMFEARMQSTCDVMDTGDERLYTLSKQKLLAELATKAKGMVEKGLPASMEERFVKRELAVPVLGVKREESSVSIAEQGDSACAGAESQSTSQSTSLESQSSDMTSASISTAATSVKSTQNVDSSTETAELSHLLRLRTALSFLLNAYIAPSLRNELEALLKRSSSVLDFSALDKHLACINELKKEAQALRSMSDNISRKRSAFEDEDGLEKAEAKRRKKEEEELKKKNMSRGVQQLKKADTSGMKKMSSFFSAKPAAKKT